MLRQGGRDEVWQIPFVRLDSLNQMAQFWQKAFFSCMWYERAWVLVRNTADVRMRISQQLEANKTVIVWHAVAVFLTLETPENRVE